MSSLCKASIRTSTEYSSSPALTPTPVATIYHRRMRGGAQSHLMTADDGYTYIVKFQNNPQHPRVLANELLGARLAGVLGLSVPECRVIDVKQDLIASQAALVVDLGKYKVPVTCGLQVGSRLVGGVMPGRLFDYLDAESLASVKNLAEFAGMLAFDKWVYNEDRRQAVFFKQPHHVAFAASFIDYGHCFGGGEWKFRDAPLASSFGLNVVYKDVCGWSSFDPWLTKIEEMDPSTLWYLATNIPEEWCSGDRLKLEEMIHTLLNRRKHVRGLINEFRRSDRSPFPSWTQAVRALPRNQSRAENFERYFGARQIPV